MKLCPPSRGAGNLCTTPARGVQKRTPSVSDLAVALRLPSRLLGRAWCLPTPLPLTHPYMLDMRLHPRDMADPESRAPALARNTHRLVHELAIA
ncbi:hypothetical protein PSPO01_07130 [Paraphaeosphaeria sporulosa]